MGCDPRCGAIHKRLVPGFVVDCKLEGDSRIVTFANGMVVHELIVDVDDKTCRHSWSARGEPLTHHNASIQVFLRLAGQVSSGLDSGFDAK